MPLQSLVAVDMKMVMDMDMVGEMEMEMRGESQIVKVLVMGVV
jgi:hypothetical protein